VARRPPEQGLPERPAQPVGLSVEEGVDEPAPFGLLDACQVDPDVAELALEFGQDLGQGAALVLGEALFGAGGHLFRPVGAGEEDAAARQAAAEVEQEPDRGGVGPLQVIHDQEQRMVLRQTAEDVGHLLQEVLGCQALQGMI
jgi:hypothetical protein